MAIKLNVKSVNIIWHVLLFHLRGDVPPTASRCTARCVPTYRQLRPDVLPAASPRSSGGIGSRQMNEGLLCQKVIKSLVTRHFLFFPVFPKNGWGALRRKVDNDIIYNKVRAYLN